MKVLALMVVAALISYGASVPIPLADAQDTGSVRWKLLVEHDVTAWTGERGPLDGAPGAAALGFRVNNESHGTVIITGLDRPALGVFVGLSFPQEFVNQPYRSLRVEFSLIDGTVRTVAPAGGGSAGMLFQSPDGLDVSLIKQMALFVDETADWVE